MTLMSKKNSKICQLYFNFIRIENQLHLYLENGEIPTTKNQLGGDLTKLRDPLVPENFEIFLSNTASLNEQNYVSIACLPEFSKEQNRCLLIAISEISPLGIAHNTQYQKLIIYGGSFNPLHVGHIECIRQGLKIGNVVVVPDHNPQKELEKIDLYSVVKKIAEKLPHKNLHFYLKFALCAVPNPTVNWLPQINCEQKYLLIGDDSFYNIHSWVDFANLITSLKGIYIVPRICNEVAFGKTRELLLEIKPDLEIVALETHKHQSTSSTKLRDDPQ